MKHCLLCKNNNKYCVCEHCEDYSDFRISEEGESLVESIN